MPHRHIGLTIGGVVDTGVLDTEFGAESGSLRVVVPGLPPIEISNIVTNKKPCHQSTPPLNQPTADPMVQIGRLVVQEPKPRFVIRYSPETRAIQRPGASISLGVGNESSVSSSFVSSVSPTRSTTPCTNCLPRRT